MHLIEHTADEMEVCEKLGSLSAGSMSTVQFVLLHNVKDSSKGMVMQL